jgi:hypothetical protein
MLNVGSQSLKALTLNTPPSLLCLCVHNCWGEGLDLEQESERCKGWERMHKQKGQSLGHEGLRTREFSNKCTLCPPREMPRGFIYMGN